MNAVLAALFAVEGSCEPPRYASVLLTPRFRASRHVVVLLFPDGSTDAALVAKIPRLAGDSSGVERERAVLTAIQEAREGGYTTIPHVVADFEIGGRTTLLESALVGVPLTPSLVRRDPASAIQAVLRWLDTLPSGETTSGDERFARLFERPLARLGAALSEQDAELVERTLELLEPLRQAALPTMVEHGDLSHPNLLLLRSGEIGVVDWELGEIEGLPTHDLFVFLGYVAASLARASTPDQRARALHDELTRPTGWAVDTVVRYANRMEIELTLLTPLLLACWSRYTTGLFDRLVGPAPPLDDAGHRWARASARPELARTIRADRHYALWRQTVTNAQELTWST